MDSPPQQQVSWCQGSSQTMRHHVDASLLVHAASPDVCDHHTIMFHTLMYPRALGLVLEAPREQIAVALALATVFVFGPKCLR